MIVLRTLGESVIEVDGTAYGPDADTMFAALVYLAAERGRQLSRRGFADMFWPTMSPARARHSLRQLVYRFRSLRIPVAATRDQLWIPDAVVAPTFAAEPSLARLREARARGALVIGPFLPGYDPAFSPAFTEWLDRQRSRVEAQVRKALLDAGDEHRLRGEWAEREALAREVLRLDPFNQAATMAIAESAAMTGAVSEAVAILERYESEFGAEHAELVQQTTVLRRRIAEHFPARRYRIPSDRCFVGREALMSQLTVCLLRARNREGSAILLWGPPGIGKTRIANELTSLGAMHGIRMVQVQCEESDGRQPMAAFVDAVPQLLRTRGALGVSPDAMPFLRRLTEFDPTPREPSPEARDPHYLSGRIRQAIVDLVDAVAGEGPLLLLFEDVHWMDASSWATLRTLIEADAARSVLVLLTSRRPHATSTPPQREVPRLELCEVGALGESASTTLVQAIAQDYGAPLPPGAEAWCGAVGEGNPLFLRELAVHCLEGGEPRAVPPSVQSLLDARLARLRPAARRALQAAAVLGEQSTLDRLIRVLEIPTHELLGALDELAEAGLVASTETLVRPRHELVATRVAAATSTAARQLLHRQAAIVLEGEVERGASAGVLWACAEHWQASGDSSRGLNVLLTTAAQMIEVGLPTEAAQVYSCAARFAITEHDQLEVSRATANALGLAGEWRRSADMLAALVARERDVVSPGQWADDVLSSIEANVRTAGYGEADAALAQQLSARHDLPTGVRLRAAVVALKIATNVNSPAIARLAWDAIDIVAPGNRIEQRAKIEAEMIYQLSFGTQDQGFAAYSTLKAYDAAESSTIQRVQLQLYLGDAASIAGDARSALSHSELAYGFAAQVRAEYYALRAAIKAAVRAITLGDVTKAVLWHTRAVELTPSDADPGIAYDIADVSARLRLLQGDANAGAAVATVAYQAARMDPNISSYRARNCTTTLVECLLAAEKHPVDPTLTDELRQFHSEMNPTAHHDRTVAVLAAAIERESGRARAVHLVRVYLDRCGRLPSILDPFTRVLEPD